MTKKDFQAFADAIKELRKFSAVYDKDGDAAVKVKEVEEMCADIFARDNGRFDRERFYLACGEIRNDTGLRRVTLKARSAERVTRARLHPIIQLDNQPQKLR